MFASILFHETEFRVFLVQKGTRVAPIHGAEFRVVFSSVEGVRTEFREFASIFVPQYRIPSIFLLCRMVRNGISRFFCAMEQPEFRADKTNCSIYSVFRGIIFLSEIANPSWYRLTGWPCPCWFPWPRRRPCRRRERAPTGTPAQFGTGSTSRTCCSPEAGVSVRKLRQLSPEQVVRVEPVALLRQEFQSENWDSSAKLSGLAPGISSCSVDSAVS